MKNPTLFAAAFLLILGSAHSGTASSPALQTSEPGGSASLNLPVLGIPKPTEMSCQVVYPVAEDDYVSTAKNTTVNFSPLWNDTDTPDQDFWGFTQPYNGTLVQVGIDSLEYTPNAGYVGSDTFTYTLGGCLQCSGSWCTEPASDQGRVYITVTN